MQRVEGAISGMGETMGRVLVLLRSIDEKLDRIGPHDQRSGRTILTRMNAKFATTQEEIP